MSKPGAFLPPANFEQVSWKAGLPKKKELWLVQLPLSVDTDSLAGVTVKIRGSEGVIGNLTTDDGTALRVLDEGEVLAQQLYAIDPGAASGRQVRRISRRITLATAPPERFGAGAGASGAAAGGGSGAQEGGDGDDGAKKKKKKKDKERQKEEAAEKEGAGAGGDAGEEGKKSKKRKHRDADGEAEAAAAAAADADADAADEDGAGKKKKKKKSKE